MSGDHDKFMKLTEANDVLSKSAYRFKNMSDKGSRKGKFVMNRGYMCPGRVQLTDLSTRFHWDRLLSPDFKRNLNYILKKAIRLLNRKLFGGKVPKGRTFKKMKFLL